MTAMTTPSATLYSPGDAIVCPELTCAKLQEGQAKDYVHPGKVGEASVCPPERCPYCGTAFVSERLPNGLISVREVPEGGQP